MRPFLLLLIATLGLSSCISVRNHPYTGIKVKSQPGSQIVYDCDRYHLLVTQDDPPIGHFDCDTYKMRNYNYLVATRTPDAIPLTIINDTTQRTIYIKPHLSLRYYANILNFGIGFKRDRHIPHRFTYPRRVFVNMHDTGNYYTYYPRPRKGGVEVLISPPLFNVYNLSFGRNIRVATPITGITLGANYRYHQKRGISLTGGAAISSTPFCPDGCGIGDTAYVDTGTNQSAWFISLQHHHVLGRFDIGYGIHGGARKWHKLDIREVQGNNIEHTIFEDDDYAGIGPVLSARFQVFRILYAGFEYQPFLLKIQGDNRKGYSHIINIGLQLRIPTTPYWRK